MKQLEFDFFTTQNKYDIDNFIVLPSNHEAFYFLTKDSEITDKTTIDSEIIFLSGEEKCGKTYLANIWRWKKNAKFINYTQLLKLPIDQFNSQLLSTIEKYDYYIIEDLNLDKLDEDKLFHLINIIYSTNSHILITSIKDIRSINLKLKDLKSRVGSSIVLRIRGLFPADKPIMLAKFFSDKQLKINQLALNYLNNFVDKYNYKKLYNLVEKISSLIGSQTKKNITIPFLKSCFHKI